MRLQFFHSHLFAIFLLIAIVCLTATTTISDEIHLTTGEIIKGEIVSQDEQAVTVEHEIFGRITIPADKISSINEKPSIDQQVTSTQLDAVSPAGIDITQAVEDAKPQPVISDTQAAAEKSNFTKFLERWGTGFEVGFNGASGNSNTFNIYTALNMKKENEAISDRLRIRYFFETKEGDATRNDGDGTWWRDWNLEESKWLYSLITKVETDKFKSWDYRLTGNIGVGYHLNDQEPLKTTIRAGIGATKEFGSIDESFEPEGSLGVEVGWKINGWLSLQANAAYLPKLADIEDYRMLASLDWLIKMDNRLNLKLGIDNEYDSVVDPGNENNDLKTYGAIVVQY